MLRASPSGPCATEEPNGNGMEASSEPHDAGRDADRPRSAPAFCVPRAVPPKPYRAAGGGSVQSRPAPARVAPPRPVIAEPPRTVAASAYEPSRRISAQVEPRGAERETGSVRPFWEERPAPRSAEPDDEPKPDAAVGPAWTALARGVALLFGTLLVVDLFGGGGLPDGGPWWLDTRPLPAKAATGLLGLSAAALLAFGARASLPKPVRTVATVCLVLLLALALKNATVYYGLLKRGDLHAGPAVAFPLHVAACLGVVLIAVRSAPRPGGIRDLLLALVGFNGALAALPVAQMACCGPVDGRRPAAAAVVFAPRTFEADAEARLDARVRTAVELHRTGLVPKIVLAGGPDGERLARLKKIAVDGQVPDSAIKVLAAGNEAVTAAELGRQYPAENGAKPTLLAVSDFDHLPRVAIVGGRAGLNLATVPAKPSAAPDRQVLVREMVELWRCYFGR